jgi:hypothetical protein
MLASSCVTHFEAPSVTPNFVARTPLRLTYAIQGAPRGEDSLCFGYAELVCGDHFSERLLESLDHVMAQQFTRAQGPADVVAQLDLESWESLTAYRASAGWQLEWRFTLTRASGEPLVELHNIASNPPSQYIGPESFGHLERQILEQIRSALAEATACGHGSALCAMTSGQSS